MNCLHCGAKMEKSDIFCITCGTPVVTDDDITLMPNAETTKFVNEAQYSGPDPHKDDILYTAVMPSETAVFNNKSGTGETELLDEKQSPDIKPVKDGGRKTIIIILAAVFAVVIGFGLFLLLRSPAVPNEDPDTTPPSAGTNGEPGQTQLNVDPTPEIPQDVTAITLLVDSRVQTEFHTRVNERISIRVQLEPEGVTADITFASSDEDVIQIRQSADGDEFEADIWGVAAGVADIIIIAGGHEERFIVFVDNLPMHDQLNNVIADSSTPIWITLVWTEGSYAGDEIVLERNPNNQAWYIDDTTEIREIYPVFGSDVNALTIEIIEYEGVFHLFADGTGYITDPRSSVLDLREFRWEFKTTLIEPEG